MNVSLRCGMEYDGDREQLIDAMTEIEDLRAWVARAVELLSAIQPRGMPDLPPEWERFVRQRDALLADVPR